MRLIVVGAGGHAKVVIDTAQILGHEVVAVIGDPDGVDSVLSRPVVASREGVKADAFIIAVGDNRERARLFAEWTETGLEPMRVLHPSAIIGADVPMGEGVFVAAGVVINAQASIDDNVILNTGCRIDHDVHVSNHAHVGPGATVCGGVEIAEGALVGVGSCVVPSVTIGSWSVIGAGGAVVDDVPADTVCVGVPARAIEPADA